MKSIRRKRANRRRRVVKIILIILLALIVLLLIIVFCVNRQTENKSTQISDGGNSNTNLTAEATGIIDGDTFFIKGGEKVRLICIDAPEFGDAGYWEARRFLEAQIKNQNITLVKDISERDSYGRLLRYVYTSDGIFINELAVREGLAKTYPYGSDVSLCPKIQEAEKYARENNLGAWNISG